MKWRVWLGGLATAVLACATSLGAAADAAVPSPAAIAHLNAQRSANGIPAGVRSVPSLARGCRKHNDYMRRNRVLSHGERPGAPGHSAAGDRAGQRSVLAMGMPPWRGPLRNPWEASPIHLAQLLAPSLSRSGYSHHRGFACAQTLTRPRRPEPRKLEVYTYPGPGATIYRSLRAHEQPYTPGELIGLRGRTGPYLYVLLDGPDRARLEGVRIVSASLRRLHGEAVRLRWISSSHPRLRGYVPPGGFLIPTRPLRPRTSYRARVVVAVGGKRHPHSWTFATDSRSR